jgi:hypothetical protein
MLGWSYGFPSFLLFSISFWILNQPTLLPQKDPTVPTPTAVSDSPIGGLKRSAIMFFFFFVLFLFSYVCVCVCVMDTLVDTIHGWQPLLKAKHWGRTRQLDILSLSHIYMWMSRIWTRNILTRSAMTIASRATSSFAEVLSC